MTNNLDISTNILSTCLFYSIKKYFELKKQGYIPEFVFSNWHWKVYLWTTKTCTSYEFLSNKEIQYPFLFAIAHIFIPYYGKEFIQKMEF